jgi:hypothetical protein
MVKELEDIYQYLAPALNPCLQVTSFPSSSLPPSLSQSLWSQAEAKVAHSLAHYYRKLSKAKPLVQQQQPTDSLSLSASRSLHSGSGSSAPLLHSLPEIFDQMGQEGSPWASVFHSTEPLVIVSCCAPHVILSVSEPFLSAVLRCAPPQQPSLLRLLFGTPLQALTSPSSPSPHTASAAMDRQCLLFQQLYSAIVTKGSGQMVTSFYDSADLPHLCLLHGYPVHGLGDTPHDSSLYRSTQLSDLSSTDRPLSSVSLCSSQHSMLDLAQHSIATALPPFRHTATATPAVRETQRCGEILYLVIAVDPLLLVDAPSSPLATEDRGSLRSGSLPTSSFRDSSSSSPVPRPTTVQTPHSSPRVRRSGSEGTLSQHLFLLYDTERALSVDQDGLFDQEDPYEGAAATRLDRPTSTASWTHLLENPLPPSRDGIASMAVSLEPLGERRGAMDPMDLLSEL